ncbi:MAG: tetratricopeptide repeat protein [Candidatus Latescibacterota bacterium]
MPECPSCKSPYAAADRYCSQCGRRLSTVEYMDSGARTQKSLDLVDVHYNLGLVYYKKGRFAEALETWQKGLARDPSNQNLLARIAEVRRRLAQGGGAGAGTVD